jgi:hypothetical protein
MFVSRVGIEGAFRRPPRRSHGVVPEIGNAVPGRQPGTGPSPRHRHGRGRGLRLASRPIGRDRSRRPLRGNKCPNTGREAGTSTEKRDRPWTLSRNGRPRRWQFWVKASASSRAGSVGRPPRPPRPVRSESRNDLHQTSGGDLLAEANGRHWGEIYRKNIRLNRPAPRTWTLAGSSGGKAYLSRSQLKMALSILPPKFTAGWVIAMTSNLSPASLYVLTCSVPTHASFQATSTLVIHLSPSMR